MDAGIQAFRKTVQSGFMTEVPNQRGETKDGEDIQEQSNEKKSGKALFILHSKGKSVEDDNRSLDSARSKKYGKDSFSLQYSEKDKKRLNRKNQNLITIYLASRNMKLKQ